MQALLAFALAATFPAAALSATITRTLDFQDNPPGLTGRSNFDYGGLRFSPSCRIHAGHSGGEATDRPLQIWLASDHDNNNCDSLAPDPEHDPYQPPNPNFLGFDWEDFYVDRHGAEFSLLGLAGVGKNATKFTVVSSKGGVFHGAVPHYDWNIPYVLPYEWFALSGPEWTDITWFTLLNTEAFGWQPHQGWDDIRYSYNAVTEPGTALLVSGGLAFLAITRRRRRSL